MGAMSTRVTPTRRPSRPILTREAARPRLRFAHERVSSALRAQTPLARRHDPHRIRRTGVAGETRRTRPASAGQPRPVPRRPRPRGPTPGAGRAVGTGAETRLGTHRMQCRSRRRRAPRVPGTTFLPATQKLLLGRVDAASVRGGCARVPGMPGAHARACRDPPACGDPRHPRLPRPAVEGTAGLAAGVRLDQ